MPRNRTRPLQGALVLIAALILSSCVSVAAESEFDADGGAVYSIQVTLDTSQLGALADLGGIDLEDQFSFGGDSEQRAEALGYTFETIQEDDLIGFRATKDDADAANVANDLNQMFSVGTESITGFSPFSGTFTQDGDTYTLDLAVDGEQLSFANIGDSADIPDLGFGNFSFEDILEITYTAKMPGEIVEDKTNGRILSDNRVRWDLPTSGAEQLTAVSSTGSDEFPLLLVLGLASFCVIGLALLTLLIIILLMRRGPDQDAEQPAETPPLPAPAPLPAAPASNERELAADAVTAQLPAMAVADTAQATADADERETTPDADDRSEPAKDEPAGEPADSDDTATDASSDDRTEDAADEDSRDEEEPKPAPSDDPPAG